MTISRKIQRKKISASLEENSSHTQCVDLHFQYEPLHRNFSVVKEIFVETGDFIFRGEMIARIHSAVSDDYLISKPSDVYLVSPVSGYFVAIENSDAIRSKVSGHNDFSMQYIPEERLPEDESPIVYFAPCTGYWRFHLYKDYGLHGACIGDLRLGSFGRVVELLEASSNTFVAVGQPLFLFYPEAVSDDVIAKHVPKFAGIQAKIKLAAESAEASAQQLAEAAKREAQEIIDAAQSEAEAELQAVKDNAAKMSLEAVVTRLYELQAKGELSSLIDRHEMRRLYVALGEMIAESQGFAAPENQSLMATQNKHDQIKQTFASVAAQVAEIRSMDWEEDEKEAAITAIRQAAEVKSGALTDEEISDD